MLKMNIVQIMMEVFYMKVKKHNLLLLACMVWLIAGFNILRIGVEVYADYRTLFNFFLSVVVFLIFWFLVFYKLTLKHTHRINGYEIEQQFFLKFFDIKSFCIMAFMMTFGIIIRTFHLMPDRFIAVFYTGLGAALFMAGCLFGWNYYITRKGAEHMKVNYMKRIMNASIVYFVLAMVAGVFYREFTKFNDYSGTTVLSVLHTHLLVLGTGLFLIIAVVCKITDLANNKLFRKFFIIYNITLPYMVLMMLVRGIVQTTGTVLSRSLNGMLSGFAGLSHIGIMISLILLLISLKKELSAE